MTSDTKRSAPAGNEAAFWWRSDNIAGVDPRILEAVVACNVGTAPAFGEDDWSRSLDAAFSDVFENPVRAFAVASGTAANALAIASIAGPFDRILCHPDSHAFQEECGASEFYSGGARFLPVSGGLDGKLAPDPVATAIERNEDARGNSYRLAAMTVTQLSEAGTAYRPEELRRLGAIARDHGLRIHMDGARFANAVAAVGATPADLTWRANVDVMSFGGTKNGTLHADAIVFFDLAAAEHFKRRLKRAGHDLSKSRFLAVQLLRYLQDSLWLDNARRANATAAEMARILGRVPDATILHPVQGNVIFVAFPDSAVGSLLGAGFRLRSKGRLPDGRATFRLVPSYASEPGELSAFAAALGR